MSPYLDDGDVTLYHGDAATVLAELPEGSVDCCVTSPPYFGLRDYGTATWEGGDPACDHVRNDPQNRPGRETPGGRGGSFPTSEVGYRGICGKCGAVRHDVQIGLEPTPEEYVAALVAVFRQVWRVLAPWGTCFVNLGDGYEGKQLLMMPARLALALQADGWWVRSRIVWAKPNPMPESVTDRPTSAHEDIYLLTKAPRYYYDAEAVREESIAREVVEHKHAAGWKGRGLNGDRGDGGAGNFCAPAAGRNLRNVWSIATEPTPEAHFATFPTELVRRCLAAGCKPGGTVLDPFVGSGTTALVARRLGLHALGIDASAEYLGIAAKRLQQLSLLGGAA